MQQQEPAMLTDLSCDALYQHYAPGIFAYFYKQTASRDVKAKQAVTTFGKVAANQKVVSLAWSPDSTGLISSIEQPYNSKTPTPVSVWALS